MKPIHFFLSCSIFVFPNTIVSSTSPIVPGHFSRIMSILFYFFLKNILWYYQTFSGSNTFQTGSWRWWIIWIQSSTWWTNACPLYLAWRRTLLLMVCVWLLQLFRSFDDVGWPCSSLLSYGISVVHHCLFTCTLCCLSNQLVQGLSKWCLISQCHKVLSRLHPSHIFTMCWLVGILFFFVFRTMWYFPLKLPVPSNWVRYILIMSFVVFIWEHSVSYIAQCKVTNPCTLNENGNCALSFWFWWLLQTRQEVVKKRWLISNVPKKKK